MGRIRTIKPEFFISGTLYDLEKETGLPIRVAFAGLWTVTDREGRFEWKPREIKAQVLPHDELDFSRVLDALATGGFLVKYACGTRVFGWIPGFLRHQSINNRESPSRLPPPPQELVTNYESEGILNAPPSGEPRVSDACVTPPKGKGKEGKERENINTLCVDQIRNEKRNGNIAPGVNHQAEITEIIGYLNSKAGTHFDPNNDANRDLIRARLDEGRTVADCKLVIEHRVSEWKGTDKEKYLRPKTIFDATNFENYYGGLKLLSIDGERLTPTHLKRKVYNPFGREGILVHLVPKDGKVQVRWSEQGNHSMVDPKMLSFNRSPSIEPALHGTIEAGIL